MTGPRIVTLDIETMPAIAEVFSLWDNSIPIQRVREPGYVFGFGFKWHDAKGVTWVQDENVASCAYNVLDTADIVVTYNGDKFDLGHLNKTILAAGLTPPSPYKSVDLYKAVKRRFNLESNKLDYVARYFDLGAKVQTDYSLWQGCMAGDERAIRAMARYCKQDVRLTEQLYNLLLPWIPNHPNVGLWGGIGYLCPACGSTHVQRRGFEVKVAVRYQRYHCQDCGKWSNDKAGERIDAELRAA